MGGPKDADPTHVETPNRRKKHAPLDFTKQTSVGRFELIRELGHGGMGQVFLARDVQLGRRVAMKFLLRDDAELVERFQKEARATARCSHENIITIYEVGEHRGLPYMVLELLEGRTLSDIFNERLSVRRVVELMIPIARALERAHELGLVHRDLKPSNVFVTDRGQVKVLDFGVARMFEDDEAWPTGTPGRTSSPDLTGDRYVGTFPYMSPEQWASGAVDHASDQWPFGIMLWRAIAREHPAGALDARILRDIVCDLETPMASIASRMPALPAALVAITDRCLAKHKADRFPDARALREALEQVYLPAPKAIAGEVSPYRGLAAFGEADARWFFGRSDDIRGALAQLERWPLLAVVGPSGVGKSSFVNAGVVPALRAAGDHRVVRVRPGRLPLARLAGVLAELAQTTTAAQIAEAPGVFGARLRAAAETRPIVLVVDQLEELFTLSDDADARDLFLSALLAAADDASSPVRVILSMRADFLDRVAAHHRFATDLMRGLLLLAPPGVHALREALVRPAELAGYRFDSSEIVDDIVGAATALPLLSFAASRLWEARDRDRKLLTATAYEEMGKVAGALARHADQVVSSIPADSHRLLRAIMRRLVTSARTRAVVDRAELTSLASASEVAAVLDPLVAGRLVVMQTDASGAATVELVHEMLITAWPTLVRWLADGQAIDGLLHDLREAARRWHAHGRSEDRLWRGATAADALARVAHEAIELATIEREFLAAVEAYARRGRRRTIAALVGIAGVVVAGFAGGALALFRIDAARTEAEAARARTETEAQTARETAQFLVGLFKVVDPSESRGNKVTAREIMDSAASRIEKELASEPAVQATLLGTVGSVYANLGLFDRAVPLLDRSIAQHERFDGASAAPTIATVIDRGWAHHLMGNNGPATVDLTRATMVELGMKRWPTAIDALTKLSGVYSDDHRDEEAIRTGYQALELARQLYGDRHLVVADALAAVTNAQVFGGTPTEAMPNLELEIQLRRELQGPIHPKIATALGALGNAYYMANDFAKGVAAHQQSLEMAKKLVTGDHPDISSELNNIGMGLRVIGKQADAERVMGEGIAMDTRMLGADSDAVATETVNLGYVVGMRSTDEGIALIRRGLDILFKKYGAAHPLTAQADRSLAYWLLRTNRLDEARQHIDRAIDTAEKVMGAEHPDMATALTYRANHEIATGHPDDGLRDANRARKILEGKVEHSYWVYAWSEDTAGAALVALGRYAEAEPLLAGKADIFRTAIIPYLDTENRRHLHALYTAWGKPDRAAAYK